MLPPLFEKSFEPVLHPEIGEMMFTIISLEFSGKKLFLKKKTMFYLYTAEKQLGFPLRISSVNATKFVGNCRFAHIY